MPIPLVHGPRHSPKVVPKHWLLSSREVAPALNGDQQAELKMAVQELPSRVGVNLSNWNWKAVRRFVQDRFGSALSRSSSLNACIGWGLC